MSPKSKLQIPPFHQVSDPHFHLPTGKVSLQVPQRTHSLPRHTSFRVLILVNSITSSAGPGTLSWTTPTCLPLLSSAPSHHPSVSISKVLTLFPPTAPSKCPGHPVSHPNWSLNFLYSLNSYVPFSTHLFKNIDVTIHSPAEKLYQGSPLLIRQTTSNVPRQSEVVSNSSGNKLIGPALTISSLITCDMKAVVI